MSNFEIYVKTSALGKTGIHWRSIESEEHQPIKDPSLIKRQIFGEENGEIAIVNDLIDEVKPSLLILRDNNKKLLLEITGIESPQRSIRLGRKVFNSMVWIADDIEENEVVLRKIAHSAIQTILQKDFSLSEMIEKSVEFYGLEEFRVNIKNINEYIGHIEPVYSHQFSNTESYPKYQIEHKSSENLEKLAEELQNYPLPKQWLNWDGKTKNDGVLIVVTENLEKRTILHKAGVWRGFANNVEEPEVVQLPQKKTEVLPPVETFPTEQLQVPHQPIPTLWRIMIMLLVGVIVILFIILGFPSPV